MLQSVCFFHAPEKAVMHSRYLAKVNFLGIKPQMYADNSSVFIEQNSGVRSQNSAMNSVRLVDE
jgi:hypothetical protein